MKLKQNETCKIRPEWDEYFFGIMDAVRLRGTCKGQAGCVIVKNNRIISTGYAGSPPGLKHCEEVGHLTVRTMYPDGIEREHCVRTIHAEQNAIAFAARAGVPLEGSTIYVNMEPCMHCAKLIIAAGIKKVICRKKYHAAEISRQFFKDAGISLEVKEDELESYD